VNHNKCPPLTEDVEACRREKHERGGCRVAESESVNEIRGLPSASDFLGSCLSSCSGEVCRLFGQLERNYFSLEFTAEMNRFEID